MGLIRSVKQNRRCKMSRFPALSPWLLALLVLAFFPAVPTGAQSHVAQAQAQASSPKETQNTGAAQAQPDTASGPTPAAGPDAQSPTLTIRQTVRRVVVDVMVRDANGKPVHGLTAKDFLLTEDRQPQRVLSFDVYDFDKPSISRGPNAPALPPNVFVNVPKVAERGPLYVMLYDLVNTEVEDQMTARQQILKFISTKPEGTRFAVFVNSD